MTLLDRPEALETIRLEVLCAKLMLRLGKEPKEQARLKGRQRSDSQLLSVASLASRLEQPAVALSRTAMSNRLRAFGAPSSTVITQLSSFQLAGKTLEPRRTMERLKV